MNREDIEAEAYRRFPIDSTDFEMMQRSDVMWDGFVEGAEWMQEQMQTEVDELHNKVSELTEALDASHIFCEGVKEHFIEGACKWISNELMRNQSYDEFATVDMIKFVECFEKYMKGE